MKVFVSYSVPLKHRVEERFTNLTGHGYFGLAAFTEEELVKVEHYIAQSVTAQMEPQEMVLAGPVVFASVMKLDEQDSVVAEAIKRLAENEDQTGV